MNGKASKETIVVPARTASGGFKTSEGTLYVSKPFRSRQSNKLRALISFAPRQSHFDINNKSSGANEFRGFFTLFWTSIFIWTVRTYVGSIEANGQALNLGFATMFSQDAITLALSDAVLVGSTFLCVPFAKAISRGWIRYYWTGVILQHTLQTLLLFIAVAWTFNRKWPWVQSGFLTLHTIVMIMKVHSYMTVNGQLQNASQQSQILLEQMQALTDKVGGWEKAILDAQHQRAEAEAVIEATLSTSDDTSEPTPAGTPHIPHGSSATYLDVPTAVALRKRLAAVAMERSTSSDTSNGGSSTPILIYKSTDDKKSPDVGPHPLIDHPDESIANIAKEYSELQSDLVSTGPEHVAWPNNISWKNFAVYQLIPSLVYELEYPRTDRIRPLYIFEKTVATFGTFALLYTVTETFILPFLPTPDQSFFRSLLDLALPFMISYLLLFYIIFECICNAFAELSYFADRQFYEDWWNSTSWDEFSRKWNKPVHAFLLRHVYAPSILSYKMSKSSAMFATFFLSACVHELVMAVVTQKIRMYLFVLQLVQIPLILVSRIPIIKRNKLMGNVVFWLGLYAGFPLLCVAYVAY
ncbi:MBOAT-domain-containing protein [Pluteus cervinus]|uniref:MBOAT-domain-containing protein n=1 Tax=Pluteus cervinus TaxID=181527 RepID=A0ACD3ABP3_9AGAR|nr:MBOAT-domain-containing protein [Pluteus cervinus]